MTAQTENPQDAIILGRDYLVFSLDGVEYGIDYRAVLETRRYDAQTIHAVKEATGDVLGATFAAGATVPVIDLKTKLAIGQERTPADLASGYLMFVRVRDEILGIRVDEGFSVVSLTPDQITEKPPAGSAVESKHLTGVGEVSFRPLLLMNLESVMLSDPAKAP